MDLTTGLIIGRKPIKQRGIFYSTISEDINPEITWGKEWYVLEKKDIEKPYSRVSIVQNKETSEMIYFVEEPPISDVLKNIIKSIKDFIVYSINDSFSSNERKANFIRDIIDKYVIEKSLAISNLDKEKIFYYIFRDFVGYGPIQVMMIDPDIEDISCDGPRLPVFIYHRRYGSMKSNVQFESDEDLDTYVVWIVQKSGKHISVANPMVDCSLPDSSRLQATLSREVTKRGSTFTIRRFKESPFTPLDLVKLKTLDKKMLSFLWLAVEHGMSAFVVGGTASGKTTTLNTLLLFIPPGKKIISIEDTREINIPHENWIPAVTKPGIGEVNPITNKRVGEVNMFDLLVATLRQRPNYIVVGEVRGQEAYTVFQAMATGHTAYTTFHADEIRAMVHRLESEPINLPRVMLTSLDLVILQGQVKVEGKLTRRIKDISEIVPESSSDELNINRVYSWEQTFDEFRYMGHSYVLDKIKNIRNWNQSRIDIELKRREKIFDYMELIGINNFRDFVNVIYQYNRNEREFLDNLRQVLGEDIP